MCVPYIYCATNDAYHTAHHSMSRSVKIGLYLAAVFLFVSVFFYGYQILMIPNLNVQGKDKMLYIYPGADFPKVLQTLEEDSMLTDRLSFAFLAKIMGYQEAVKPGAYMVKADMSNLQLLKALIKGRETPIKLTFHNLRTKQDLASLLDQKLEMGPAEIATQLYSADVAQKYGLDTNTITTLFIPNTYEVYWTIKPEELMQRMAKEYKRFWTEERKAKAKALGMTQTEVSVLASIVECETKKADEMPIVARVYKNRLDQDMKLQADPTVVFAVGDFTIKRVLYAHKNTPSPYNTYYVKGLPPGPIYLPSTTAINAVLDMPVHKYLYFCAKPDLSGYHTFAEDYDTHLANAKAYQAVLDGMNILK